MQRQLGDRVTQKIVVPLHQLLVEMLHREVRVLVAEQTQHPFQLPPRRTLRRGQVQPAILEPFCSILLIPFRPALKRPHANTKHTGRLFLCDLASGLLIQMTLKTHLTYSLVNSCRSHFVPPSGASWDTTLHELQTHVRSRATYKTPPDTLDQPGTRGSDSTCSKPRHGAKSTRFRPDPPTASPV